MRRFLSSPRPAIVAGACALLLTVAWSGASGRQEAAPAAPSVAAGAFLATLDADARAEAVLPADDPARSGWHFIPMETRKGLKLGDMTAPQRTAARRLLASLLSAAGYDLATDVMELEAVLRALENAPEKRDPQKYYFTLFGTPAGDDARWAVSIEGHHLSLNFALTGDDVTESTPAFFGSNPATLPREIAGVEAGTRVLGETEDAAFALLDSLSGERRAAALIDPNPPREIRGAGDGTWTAPPLDAAEGLPGSAMTAPQRALLAKLVELHLAPMPEAVRRARREALEAAGGVAALRFAWSGAEKPGVGHGYRVRGESLLIEFVNSQPGSLGEPANHAHSVWRDPRGDFGSQN